MREIVKKAKKQKVRSINRCTVIVYDLSPNSVRKILIQLIGVITTYVLPKKRYKKFLIFAQGRTGSTLLTDLLHSHPDIFMYDEMFNKRVIRNVRKPIYYANTLVRSQFKFSVVGIKVKIYQLTKEHNLDPKKTLQAFLDDGWKIIYLERENKLDHALSNIVANYRGSFHYTESDSSKPENLELIVDYNELIKKIERRIERTKQEKKALRGIPHFHVIYENDLLDARKHQETANNIFDYIGISKQSVYTKFKKINNRSKKDLIKNWDEIKPLLQDTPYATYL